METLKLQIAIEALSSAVLRAIAAGEGDTDAVRVLASAAAHHARLYLDLVWGC